MKVIKKYLVASLGFAAVLGFAYGVGIYFPRVGDTQEKANDAFAKGLYLYNQFQYGAARELFLQSLSYNPNFHISRRMLGQSLYFAGDIDEAVNEWKVILDQGGYDPPLRLHVQNLTSASVETSLNLSFDRIISSERGYRYRHPTFTGSLPNHNVFFLSLGQFGIGNLLELSPNGEFKTNMRRVSSKIGVPMGAAVGGGELWITDYKSDTIHILNLKKRDWTSIFDSRAALGATGSGNLEFHGPAGVCHRKGFFFVVDSGNNRVQKISGDGKFVFEFSNVESNLRLHRPFGIACDDKGRIYVTEPLEGRISIFDEFGNFEKFMGLDFLKKPRHVSIDKDHRYLTIADEEQGVFIIDLENNERQTITGYKEAGGEFTKLNRPYAASLDFFGNLLIADYGSHRMVKFVPQQHLYSNLDLWVERVYSDNFPKIGLWVSVKNQKGEFITDLDEDNFTLIENDADVGRLNSTWLRQFQKQASWLLLISREQVMEPYRDSINWVLDFFIKELREKDKVKVLSYGAKSREDSPWTNSRLRIQQAMHSTTPEDYQGNETPGLGRTMYGALSQLLPMRGKRALIWIHAGNLDPAGFGDVSLTRLENYAHNNHVPIYVISFQNPKVPDWKANITKLKELAAHTGGQYFSAYGAEIKGIEKVLRSQPEERYLLFYQSGADSDWHGQFIDLKLKVRFQNRSGMESSGYFIPRD